MAEHVHEEAAAGAQPIVHAREQRAPVAHVLEHFDRDTRSKRAPPASN